MQANKPCDTTSPPEATYPPTYNPPSYEMHSHSHSTNDPPSEDPVITQLIIDPNAFPPYTRLRRNYRVSLAINIVVVLVILPVAFVGFSMINSQTCTENDTPYIDPLNATVFTDATPFLNARAENTPWYCITGFNKGGLDYMFQAMSQVKANEGRIWNTACEDVGIVDYPDGIKAEYNYVVTDELAVSGEQDQEKLQ